MTPPPRAVITRPRHDAAPLAAALRRRGVACLIEPMARIVPVAAPSIDLDGVGGLLITSANGVRAFARLCAARALPAFTVGAASAAAARAAGFARVDSAKGDVDDLARLLVARLDAKAGALYQAAGRRLAGDLKGALEGAGFTLRRQVLYEARPVTSLSAGLRADLARGRLDAASFFSPRTAATFVRLVQNLGLGGDCAGLSALALSEAVAAELRTLPWCRMLVAERPDQGALLARLDALSPPLETEA
jgi:uroporphyrinogen-III synthase